MGKGKKDSPLLETKIKSWRKKMGRMVRIENQLVREMFAEFLGTFILMVFGNGSVAQSVLSKGAYGGQISINWAFGLGVTFAILVTGSISGAHINPAVTIAFTTFGKFPLYKLPFYVISQVAGGFVSGAAVYSVYYEAINSYDGGVRQVLGPNGTAGIFATYPAPYLTITSGFWDQVFGTALLIGILFAITDKRNNAIIGGLDAFIIGLLVFVIGLSYNLNCGYAINPARDFGPRLFTYAAGWGSGVFSEPNGMYWWWVPIVGPITGGILGALIYTIMVGVHIPKSNSSDENEYRDETDCFVTEDYAEKNSNKASLTKL